MTKQNKTLYCIVIVICYYQNKISNVDNERATPNDEFMALSQEIRFPFNNKLRFPTDLINLSGLTDISHLSYQSP